MNETPTGVIEIFLQPGEWYFGNRKVSIRTLLGSCVAMVFWHRHPKLLMGGMCHFTLPTAGPRKTTGAHKADQPLSYPDWPARYGNVSVTFGYRCQRC